MIRYPAVNRYFTLVCFGVPTVLGSTLSMLWHACAVWCLFEVLTRRQVMSRNFYCILLSILFYVYVVTSVASTLVNGAEYDDLQSLLPLITLCLFPFSYSIWSISRKADIAHACATGCIIAAYGAGAFAVFQFYALGIRAEGGAGNAIVFATASCLVGTVALAGAVLLEYRSPLVATGGYLAGVLAVLLSESRSMWVAMALVSIVILVLARQKLAGLVSRKSAAIVVLVALVFSVPAANIVWMRGQSALDNWEEIAEHDNYASSLGIRLVLWQVGWDLFKERPLLGHGMHQTPELTHRALVRKYGIDRWFSHFHNGILTLLIESGLIGAVSIVAAFAVSGYLAFRTFCDSEDVLERFGAAVLSILVVTYLVGGMSNILIGHDIIDALFMIFLIVGTFLASGKGMASEPRSN